MKKNLTLEEVHIRGRAVGSYISRQTWCQYTMWQLNWEDAMVSVVTHDNDNEIVVIYDSSADRLLYLSPHRQFRLTDLWVK